MSDSDDWEKLAEKDDAALENILKTGKFGDEQTVPVVEEPKLAPPKPKEEKKGKGKSGKKSKEKSEPEAQKSKAEIIADAKKREENADNEIAEDLFGVKPVVALETEDDYLEYAREVCRRLYKGQHHFRMPTFFIELFKETTKLMKVEDINKVISQLSVIHSERIKAEKGVKKTNNKPGLKADVAKKVQLDEDDQDEYNEYEDFL